MTEQATARCWAVGHDEEPAEGAGCVGAMSLVGRRAGTDPRGAAAGSAAPMLAAANSLSLAGAAGLPARYSVLSVVPECCHRADSALPPTGGRSIRRLLCGLGHGPK